MSLFFLIRPRQIAQGIFLLGALSSPDLLLRISRFLCKDILGVNRATMQIKGLRFMTIVEHRAEILSNDEVAPDTFLMRLRSPEIATRAAPGQFVMVRVGHGRDPLLRRPFSICGSRNEGTLLLLYRVVGKGTRILAETGTGRHLSLMGPLGHGFRAPGKGQSGLLVAGGMGLAPLVFLAGLPGEGRCTLLTGYRTATEIISLERIGAKELEVSIATEDGSAGHKGLVTELLEDELAGTGGETVYTCGPMPMLRKVAALCLERGVDCQVSLESVMACGLGACQGCAVKAAPKEDRTYLHVCRDGPVFKASAIDWGAQ
jgi:dihydroorotate dehydrogenase electron transfer subunit